MTTRCHSMERWRILLAWCAMLCCAPGCSGPDLSSRRTHIELTLRPTELDLSRINEFSLHANDHDLLTATRSFPQGSEIELYGLIELNAESHTRGDKTTLIVAYRPVIDGEVDWSGSEDVLHPLEWNCVTNQNSENGKILARCTKTFRLDLAPGDYELRYYLIIRNDLSEEIPTVCFIGSGALEVLPAE